MSPDSTIAIGQNADGRLEVFFVGFENYIYHTWENPSLVGWSGIIPFQDQTKPARAKALAVGQNADGRLEIFYIGTDDNLYHNWENPSLIGWHGEDRFEGRAKALTIGQNADGRLEIFYIGTDDKIYHNWQTAPNNGWPGEHLFDADDRLIVAGYKSFDPGRGKHINDHCFIRDKNGIWHMFGIEAADPQYVPD